MRGMRSRSLFYDMPMPTTSAGAQAAARVALAGYARTSDGKLMCRDFETWLMFSLAEFHAGAAFEESLSGRSREYTRPGGPQHERARRSRRAASRKGGGFGLMESTLLDLRGTIGLLGHMAHSSNQIEPEELVQVRDRLGELEEQLREQWKAAVSSERR